MTWSFSRPQLYESALTENQKLKTKLQEAQQELADVKSRLDKVAQVRGHGGWEAEEAGCWRSTRQVRASRILT